MSPMFAESIVEEATLEWFAELGYALAHGPDIAPDGLAPERAAYSQVFLVDRLRAALARLNPAVPAATLEDVVKRLLRPEHPSLIENNRAFHTMLREGVDVEHRQPDGSMKGDKVWLFDFDDPENNDWLAVNQFTVTEVIGTNRHHRRPDVVVFVNGIPLAVLELKNAADEDATVETAFKQFQTYKAEIPSLFVTNALLLVSDGLDARVGSLTAGKDRFNPWRTVDGLSVAPTTQPQLDVAVKGIFSREWFLDYVRSYAVFETSDARVVKKIAAYHQFHAVRKAVVTTLIAARPGGDQRAGVIWHTQGSGKSLTMLFYAGKLIEQEEMENPTIVVLTDRNDLDDQLFGTFASGRALLRQTPEQATDRGDLREKLRRASGGVVFTTIQKFLPDDREAGHPLLSDRRNIVVIADEAHRTQYGFRAKVDRDTGQVGYGFAKYCRDALPNATFIAFTGTPVERADVSTRGVFGNEIDIYDIERAIADKATVPIYYEGRLVRLGLDEHAAQALDEELEEVTEGEELTTREKLKTKWAALEAVVGAKQRVEQVAADLVQHFEDRLSAMEGKAMVVAMSRRICMDLHDEIVKLRPGWYHDDDDKGQIKVVMTGNASEGERIARHSRSKQRREALAKRFKDPTDPLKLVIVRDMWLTGFDCPCLHTLYVDKPMRGHGLMQAIARVNRVFRDKPGGLVVDYIGIADQLKKALTIYTESGGEGRTTVDQAEAVAVMLEKYEIVEAMFHGFDYGRFFSARASERVSARPAGGRDHIGPPAGRGFGIGTGGLAEWRPECAPHDHKRPSAGKLDTGGATRLFVVIDKARLHRLIAITRDDRRPRDQGAEGPYFRMEASGDSLRLSGRLVEVTVPATVHEPGVLFLKITLFRRMLRMLPERGFLAIQANAEGVVFGDVRLPLDSLEALLYPDAATAPERHPAERDDGPEQIPRHSENLFDP